MRIIAYIDGFNLYHAIDDLGKFDPRRPNVRPNPKPHLKWLNLWSLCQGLARPGEAIVEVNYFSAYAGWLQGAQKRHFEYVKALEHVGVNCVMGHFKSKPERASPAVLNGSNMRRRKLTYTLLLASYSMPAKTDLIVQF